METEERVSAKSGTYVPRIATLDGFKEFVRSNHGINVKDILAGTVLEIKVSDAVFTLVITDSARRKVKVRGKFLPELTECTLLGSSFGGGCNLMQGWLGIGMCMNLITPTQEPGTTFVTAPIAEINIVISGTRTIQ